MMMSMPMSMRGSLVQRTTPNPSACSTHPLRFFPTNPTNERGFVSTIQKRRPRRRRYARVDV